MTEAPRRAVGRPRGPAKIRKHYRVLQSTADELRQRAAVAGVDECNVVDEVVALLRDADGEVARARAQAADERLRAEGFLDAIAELRRRLDAQARELARYRATRRAKPRASPAPRTEPRLDVDAVREAFVRDHAAGEHAAAPLPGLCPACPAAGHQASVPGT